MIAFQVNDMTCGHCVGVITKTVQALDPQASVKTDLATHQVQIESGKVGAAELGAAIAEAGYTPVLLGSPS